MEASRPWWEQRRRRTAADVAGTLPGEVGRMIETVPGVSEAVVRLVWDPPWGQERMTEEARLELGLL